MSLHYLLDGYNIIHQMRMSEQTSLENQRLGLVRFVEQQCPQGSRRNKVTIVFDGQETYFGSPLHRSSVRVIFSRGETADDKIKRLVEQERNPKSVVVVSDDRSIQKHIRLSGARVMTVCEFLTVKKSFQGHKQQKVHKRDDKDVPYSQMDKITDELKGIWLKRNKDPDNQP